jgi:hypothetical protein
MVDRGLPDAGRDGFDGLVGVAGLTPAGDALAVKRPE